MGSRASGVAGRNADDQLHVCAFAPDDQAVQEENLREAAVVVVEVLCSCNTKLTAWAKVFIEKSL